MVKSVSFGNETEIAYDGNPTSYAFDIVEIKNIKSGLDKFPYQNIKLAIPANTEIGIIVKLINELKPKNTSKNKIIIAFEL